MDQASFDSGAWIGKCQAFRLVGAQCSAAEAKCLKTIRDAEIHKELNLPWDTFCSRYLGMSRVTAERVIMMEHEFGEIYFKLCEITRIPPASYRQIREAVSPAERTIEFDGEKIPIDEENADRVKKAVTILRARAARIAITPLDSLRNRIRKLVFDISAQASKGMSADHRLDLAIALEEAAATLRALAEQLQSEG